MFDIQTVILTVLSSVLASSGMWSVVLFKLQKKEAREKAEHEAAMKAKEDERKARDIDGELLMALAHDKIYYLGKKFLKEYAEGEIKYMNTEELANFEKLYKPYRAKGGNGLCEMVHDEVMKIPRIKPRKDGEKE